MWSDELDNKMKEATEGSHLAYDDKAWDKMELLLDKHLPQEKKRRRFILLLLPLLLVGTGIYLFIQGGGKDEITRGKTSLVKTESVKRKAGPETSVTVPSDAKGSASAVIPGPTGVLTPVNEPVKGNRNAETKTKEQIFDSHASSSNNKKVKKIFGRDQEFKQQTSAGETEDNSYSKGSENNRTTQTPLEQNKMPVPAIVKGNLDDIKVPVSRDTSASIRQIARAAEEEKQPDSSEAGESMTETKPQKRKSSRGNKLSLNFSAGPDISSVGMDNPGKWNLQYGIGVSYAISKRLSIRTGFFAGRKKYSADSTEYYSSYYPPKLERIDANCLVYEIPVNLVYHFPAARKHNWFVAGGLSSYLMKKEIYDYFYKNAWGQSQYYRRTYKNENSHLFSVINVSGGYQYHFTDRLSLLAEPYVRIPVRGIGSGKVKLNSGGILFTVGFKPFLKRN